MLVNAQTVSYTSLLRSCDDDDMYIQRIQLYIAAQIYTAKVYSNMTLPGFISRFI